MTFPSSHSFYVTLLSQDDKEEFPHNQPRHFKNRLPRPIRFVGSDWQVGLVRLSIPDVPVVAKNPIDALDHVIYIRWHIRVWHTVDKRYYHYRQVLHPVGRDMTQADLLLTGQEFFKSLVRRYDQERAKQVEVRTKLAEDDGTKLYPTFEWTKDGDLVLNTEKVDYTHQVAQVCWGKKFALFMGWIIEPSPGKFQLGPNIVQEFHSDTVPDPTDTTEANKQPTFWLLDASHLKLSMSCNWRFVNLNTKFRPTKEFAPERSLFVHCDAGVSRMVGNRVTNVLREINYRADGTTTHFEALHIHYLPVRSGLMEIIETQVTETNNNPVTFAKGQTLLTLHFKKG